MRARRIAGFVLLALVAAWTMTGTASAATVVVTPSNLQGWGFAQEGPTGSGSFVNGPATPPSAPAAPG